ncbi:hypothetical protein HWV62_16570 [Athelia sp. TMB]|nr:hypothetical protein HWV62_16570 [Athelia sp. TMB]
MPPDSPLVSSPQSTTFSHEKRTSFFSKATGAPRTTGKKRRSTGAKFDEIIPHPSIIKNGARNLVLCFDGTGDQFDDDNSNIVKLFSMLKRDDVKQQLVYYQAGIGTYTIPEIANPWTAKLQKTLDMMVGKNLNSHIMAGYEFLMQNFIAGDKIFIFGFSRGAYTARALAGMVHKVGLLPPCNHQQVPFAYKMYKRNDKKGWDQSTKFKKTFSIDVDIEFVGVWDTVASVGIVPRRLPFTASNSHIRHFRHAISLDERRARFKPNLWNHATKEDEEAHARGELGVKKGEMQRGGHDHPYETDSDDDGEDEEGLEPAAGEQATRDTAQGQHKKTEKGEAVTRGDDETMSAFERRFEEQEASERDANDPTDILEVWFSGAHTDVGGGSVANGTRHNLARIPLRWMVRQCFLLKLPILWHAHAFTHIGLDPKTLYPKVLPRPEPIGYTPNCIAHQFDPPINKAKDYKVNVHKVKERPFESEEMEDMLDALTPIYDQLRMVKFWWVLELIPTKHRYQHSDKSWVHKKRVNLGGPRHIPKIGDGQVFVHRTVKIRMEAEGFFSDEHYKPAARLDFEPEWVA